MVFEISKLNIDRVKIKSHEDQTHYTSLLSKALHVYIKCFLYSTTVKFSDFSEGILYSTAPLYFGVGCTGIETDSSAKF